MSDFTLDKPNGRMMGVCAGIARHFSWDVTFVRIAFVLGAFASLGTALLIYLAIGLIAPAH